MQKTRRSASGGVALYGADCVHHWSSTQSTVALSSGEAELNGIARGAAHGLGFKRMATDLGFTFGINLHSDAIAAIGIARRRGVGRIRHLDTTDLWVQEKCRCGEINLQKIDGASNPADMFFKYLPQETLNVHIQKLGLVNLEGRPISAPSLVSVS